jgi:hypothetical protein
MMVEHFKRARRFRNVAEQLLEIAARARDPVDHAALEEVAREYYRMADPQTEGLVRLQSWVPTNFVRSSGMMPAFDAVDGSPP